MNLLDIITNASNENLDNTSLAVAIEKYTAKRTTKELLTEIERPSIKKIQASKKIHEYGLEYFLFTAITKITAIEEIIPKCSERKGGYRSLSGLATLLRGNSDGQTKNGKFFKNLAKQHNIPALTQEHQQYLDDFNLEYVAQILQETLAKELNFEKASLNETNKIYNPFFAALSNKISSNNALTYAVMRKITGWEAIEEITRKDINGKKGYGTLTDLATLLRGNSNGKKENGKFFKDLAKQHNIPALTQEHQQYLDNFNLEYVAQISQKTLTKELNFEKASLDETKHIYNHFFAVLSNKISSDSALTYAVMRKITGWEAIEEITRKGRNGKEGYSSLYSLATLLRGSSDGETKNRKFFKNLAKQYNMPVLTQEHQQFIDNFNIEYVAQSSQEILAKELDFGNASLDESNINYDFFFIALTRKISSDSALTYAVMCKITGWEAIEEITKKDINGKKGYKSLSGLATLLRGSFAERTENSKFFKDLFITGTLQSKWFHDYCAQNNITLDNPAQIEPEQLEYLTHLLGKDFFKYQSKQTKIVSPNSRKRVTEWSEQDMIYLHAFCQAANGNEKDLLNMLTAGRDVLQEDLGRSLWAIMRKVEHMNYLTSAIVWGNGQGKTREIAYPFPPIHDLFDKTINPHILFSNNAYLIERGYEPFVIPVFAYYDTAKDNNGIPQFVHVSIPVAYKGIELSQYSNFEQLILGTVQAYISDPTNFKSLDNNSLTGKPEEEMYALHLKDYIDGELRGEYPQLLQRTRFIQHPEKITTAALKISSGTEIYFFMHEQNDVTFETIMPKQIHFI